MSIWSSPLGLPRPTWARAKKAHIEKKVPNKKAHKTKNPTKVLLARANQWAFIFHMKNILFFKIYYYLWDRSNKPDKHDDSNRSNNLDLPDDLDKNDDSNGPDDPNRLNDPDDPGGPDNQDKPDNTDGPDHMDGPDDPDGPYDPN